MLRNLWFAGFAVGSAIVLFALAKRLYYADFRGVRSAMAKRSPERFEGRDLTERNFEGAFLPYADFRRAKLHETMLSRADVRFADFSGADFETAGVGETDFSHAILHGAKLRGARWLENGVFRYASFRGTDLSWVSFHGLYGTHRRSKRRHMMDPGAGGADMSGAVFEGAVCEHTIFSRCILARANFKDCDCREADFSNADLTGADFTNADLRGAKFDDAELAGAIFTNAKR